MPGQEEGNQASLRRGGPVRKASSTAASSYNLQVHPKAKRWTGKAKLLSLEPKCYKSFDPLCSCYCRYLLFCFVFTLLYVICLWLLTHATPVTSHLLVLHKRSVSTLFPLHYICRSRCEEDTLWTLTKPGITLCTCTLHTDHGYVSMCVCVPFSRFAPCGYSLARGSTDLIEE